MTGNGGIEVVCYIKSVHGTYEARENDVPNKFLQRQSILFINRKKEERQHGEDHDESGHAWIQ